MSEKRASSAKKAIRSATAQFEKLLKQAVRKPHYVLKLYITGTTLRSCRAIANIRALCDEYLPGHYDLEVVDIYQQPWSAANEQIIAAPTLIKKLPKPLKRMVGDLSNRNKVLIGLALAGKTKWVNV